MLNLGNVPAGMTLYIPFATYGGTNGESITMTGLAVTDIEIYKNGSATQRASDAGYALLDTDGIDFDGITGIHGFSIDLSDDTDSGFFAVGSSYWVVVSAVTVDSQTVNFIAAVFRIVAAENVTGYPVADAAALGGAVQSATDLKDFADTGYNPSTHKVAGVVLSDTLTTYTGNTPQTGDSFARIGATGSGLTSLAQASVLGTLATSAGTGDPNTAKTIMAYAKQLVNVLIGTSGIATFPAESAPANAVSLAEVIRAIHADVTGIAGSAMRGTDSAALASDMATVLSRLSSARAGYLDNLSAGAVALEATLTAIKGAGWTDENLTTLDALLDALTAAVGALPTAAGIADAVCDEALSGHTTAGTVAKAIADIETDADATRFGSTVQGDAIAAALAVVDGIVDAIVADTGTDGVVVASGSKTGYALTSGERDSIAAALLDLANGIETGYTPRQVLRIIAAAVAGKLSGAATATNTIRDITDAKDRITATVDADGNRTAITLDVA